MKRIKAACICQTLHFLLKEDTEPVLAQRLVQDEVAAYRKRLEVSGAKYRILSEKRQTDGSVILRIKKQYNQSPVGDYLDE